MAEHSRRYPVCRVATLASHHWQTSRARRYDVKRDAAAGFGDADAQVTRLFAPLRRQPHAVVPPQARPVDALVRGPALRVDAAATPAVFDQKFRRRPRVERGDLIVSVTAERRADRPRLAQRQVVGLPDIVEIAELDHEVMDAVLAGSDEGKAVVARIDMKEIGIERPQDVVAELETKDIRIERRHVVEPLNGEYRVSHAERTGAETGDGAARLEGLQTGLGPVERFEPVSDRVAKDNQVLDAAFVGERA